MPWFKVRTKYTCGVTLSTIYSRKIHQHVTKCLQQRKYSFFFSLLRTTLRRSAEVVEQFKNWHKDQHSVIKDENPESIFEYMHSSFLIDFLLVY